MSRKHKGKSNDTNPCRIRQLWRFTGTIGQILGSTDAALFDEFSRAFHQSDILLVLPIYAAGEKEIEGVNSYSLYEDIKAHGHKDIAYMNTMEESAGYLKGRLEKGDILLTLGAGDVWKVGEEILQKLKAKSS